MPFQPLPGPAGLVKMSAMPRLLLDSTEVGWQGCFFTSLVGAPTGTLDQVHRQYCLVRSASAVELRPRGARSWNCLPAGVNIWQPGTEQRMDWQRGGPAQFLYIAPEHAERVLDGDLPLLDVSPYGTISSRVPDLILQALDEDLAQGSPAGPLVGDTLIAGLLAHLAGSAQRPATLKAPARERVIEFIDTHLARRLSLDDLAAVAGVSVRQFSRRFRTATGQSPHQYLLSRRVERAKVLIASHHSLVDVALLCGFADQSIFTRTFARCVGVTPARYRASLLS
jgi:AraC-like DNA-binding protein